MLSELVLRGAEPSNFFGNLQRLLAAGLSLERALEHALPRRIAESQRQALIQRLKDGAAFSALLKTLVPRQPAVCALIEAGEASGKLGVACQAAETLISRQLQLKRSLSSALFYPALMFAAMLGLLSFVIWGLWPSLLQSFGGMGLAAVQLEHSRKVLQLLLTGLMVLLGVLALVARRGLQGLPMLGVWIRQQQQSFFLLSLAQLCEQGIPLHAGVPYLLPLLSLSPQQGQVFVQSLEKGHALSAVMASVSPWSPEVIQGLAVGEAAGQLGAQLHAMGFWLREHAEQGLADVLRWSQPILLGCVTALVAFVLYSVFAPLLGLYDQLMV